MTLKSEMQIRRFDLMQLRARGFKATRVDRYKQEIDSLTNANRVLVERLNEVIIERDRAFQFINSTSRGPG